MKTFLVRAAVGVLATLSLTAGQARAGFTITLDGTSPSGANTSFNYSATIPEGDRISTGDYFRIYDFQGLVASASNPSGYAITAPSGWSAAVTLSNPTPPPYVLLTHGDDPAINNITFTYNGAASIVGNSSIASFQAVSTIATLGSLKDFAGRDTKSTGMTTGTPVDSVGEVRVPGPLVPEPSSVVSAAIGLALLAGAAVRRRARA